MVSYQIDRKHLYEEVVNALYDMIDKEDIQPGDKFPSERELQNIMNVSRNVLREAFHILENRGIVVSVQGSGRYLREIPDASRVDRSYGSIKESIEKISLKEAYEVRQVLEAKAMDLVIRNAKEDDIVELEQCIKELEAEFEQSGTTAGEFKIHSLYAKKTHSVFMENMINMTLSAIRDMMYTTFTNIMSIHEKEREITSHKAIIAAIREKDKASAEKLMYEHIADTMRLLE